MIYSLLVFPSLSLVCLYVQHGAAVVQDKLYIYGGNHNGRYLNDLHVSIHSIYLFHEAIHFHCVTVYIVRLTETTNLYIVF